MAKDYCSTYAVKLFLSLLLLCMSVAGFGQQTIRVEGLVFDDARVPLIGVTITVKGTSQGTVTDIDGKFSLSVAEGSDLLVTSIGYESVTAKARTGRMEIVLQESSLLVDEVVVTGYGITKKAAFTGAAQIVGSDEVLKRTDANFMKSLEGAVAGLQVNNGTGQPGAYATTTIRGIGSINSGTEPLYVVDGIPIYTDKMGAWSGMEVSPIANINPNDIESITVLKDATATSIYGARAANGVIVISTKKGKEGKTRFNFNAKVGVSYNGSIQNDYRLIGLDKYKKIWSEGYVNSGDVSSEAEGYELLKENALDWYGFDIDNVKSIDWLDEVLKSGVVQEYTIDLQGGSQAGRFFASLGYYSNEGTMIGSGMKRYSGRLNLEGESGRIGYGVSIDGGFSDINNIPATSSYTNPMVLVYDTRPFQQIYNPDGSYALVHDGYYNAVALYDKEKGDIYNQKNITAIVNPYFTYTFMDGLKWKTNAGINVLDINEFFFSGSNNPSYWDNGLNGEKYNYRATVYTITNTLNFNRSFKDAHNLNILLGQEAQRVSRTSLEAAATNYPSDVVVELVNASTPIDAVSTSRASTLASFFFNGEYNYNNKYYGSASFRYDASSRFGSNNRWAPFWSVGAKYRLTQEPFMESAQNWLTDLTIRGSYGTVGNQDIGNKYYAYMGLYEYGYSYNSNPGAVPSQISSPNLKWETVTKADIGINAVLFNRINLELDFYNQRTSDMIFDVPLSYTTGFKSVLKNIGEMQNTGFEFLVNATLLQNKSFSWKAHVNGSINKNEITALATDKPIEGTWNIRKVGEAYNTFYLPVYAGVDPETGVGLFYKSAGSKETTTRINEAEQQIVGSADPDFYGGIGTSFTFKGFDLSIDGSFSLGNKVFNRGLQYDLMVGDYELGPVANYVYDNRWQYPGQITNVPKFIAGGNNDVAKLSTRFLMDASYFRMKAINLGYTFPKSIAKALTVDNLRVYASVDNLFVITASDFIGFDPRAAEDGYQQWTYPIPTTVMFGVNVSF
ncbi:SusC/RagA family TonB-linked outer membrane protein [Bacteroidia bacterium]|nr:SusC/RagA family TonB-linked outer membrane protein [Bacteroidia bacterium]GHU83444.1 SusC/RagA family TonB-linked outer membrane protein [Bacteroidia bacterium]